jgi:glutathione synthase/RimK-type ligase-like ATP-grasp enzyme
LGIKMLRLTGSTFVQRPTDTILNWGSRAQPGPGRYINEPRAVGMAGNKLRAFRAMRDAGVSIPEFTTDPVVAKRMLDNGGKVVVRACVRGSKGAGISIVDGAHEGHIPDAPLYTKYMPKKDEFRVHVVRSQVIDIAQKRVRNGSEGNNFQIRNTEGGWIYAREDVECPAEVQRQAIAAVEACGLDFGAVDVGWNRTKELATVYEVNTAPGLEGTTLERYTDAIASIL